jgi:hypothetical protein
VRLHHLVSESARGVKDLPPDVFVKVRWLGIRVEIFLAHKDGSERQQEPMGYVGMVPHLEGYGGAYEVLNSFATHGWGPFLYDIAIEYAGEFGVIPDQRQSSPAAQALWDFYKTKRPDVEQRVVSRNEWDVDDVTAIVKRGRPTMDALKASGRWLG